MESIVFRLFGALFQTVGILILTGVLVAVLGDIQKRAFESKRTGLTSMLKINEQLVGKLPVDRSILFKENRKQEKSGI